MNLNEIAGLRAKAELLTLLKRMRGVELTRAEQCFLEQQASTALQQFAHVEGDSMDSAAAAGLLATAARDVHDAR